jgi:hypothetical protein
LRIERPIPGDAGRDHHLLLQLPRPPRRPEEADAVPAAGLVVEDVPDDLRARDRFRAGDDLLDLDDLAVLEVDPADRPGRAGGEPDERPDEPAVEGDGVAPDELLEPGAVPVLHVLARDHLLPRPVELAVVIAEPELPGARLGDQVAFRPVGRFEVPDRPGDRQPDHLEEGAAVDVRQRHLVVDLEFLAAGEDDVRVGAATSPPVQVVVGVLAELALLGGGDRRERTAAADVERPDLHGLGSLRASCRTRGRC